MIKLERLIAIVATKDITYDEFKVAVNKLKRVHDLGLLWIRGISDDLPIHKSSDLSRAFGWFTSGDALYWVNLYDTEVCPRYRR